MTEIERRFLVDVVPEPLPRPTRIVQGYLMTGPPSVRVRSADGIHTLTVKAGSGLQRLEIEHPLDAAQFDVLYATTVGRRVDKRRHRIDLGGGHTAELDLFDGALAGHRLVEVEFGDVAGADGFVAPAWFGVDVTDDHRYTNAVLATAGWPGG
jgi:CYTH domain-containing protein